MYLNKTFVLGNLTRDPELRALPSGGNVASFSLATNRVWRNKEGEKQEQTEFHNVVAFGHTAEIVAQYLRKGGQVLVEGRLQTRSWEQDGQKKYRTEIVVENVQFGVQTRSETKIENEVPENEKGYSMADANPEDIPF